MDSYDILGVTRESSDKEIEIAYEDLKRKYDPSFNTSIYAYKKYREIQNAYENIKDEQRRKMYDLKDDEEKINLDVKEYELYSFEKNINRDVKTSIDYNKIEIFEDASYKDIEINLDISYLYYLLNLKYDLEYYHRIKCDKCEDTTVCNICNGEKVVEYKQHLVWCPNCGGTGKVSVNCRNCGDSGFNVVKDMLSFYVDEDVKEFKGGGDEYSNNLKSNLILNLNFYDKENIKVNGDIIEINYYLSKEETLSGVNKEYFGEHGAFKLNISNFVSDGYKEEISFNNKKIIFTFFNEKYDAEDKIMYLFINKVYKDKFIYFNENYSYCSEVETIDCNIMVKCDSKVIIKDKGNVGKYGGSNGDLVINIIFNDEKDLIYTDKVKVFETSKAFNLLGGPLLDNEYHFGFKGSNSLIKRKDFYYLLKGNNGVKNKLKNYFLFKVLCVCLWVLIPFFVVIFPYDKNMFISLIITLIIYSVLVNILMEVEV